MDFEAMAVTLAEAVAPQEVSLAPIWAQAYADGGASRRELVSDNGAVAGGFSPDSLAVVMPYVFDGIHWTSATLIAVLGSKMLGDLLSCAKSTLTLAELRHKVDQVLHAPSLGAPESEASAPGSPLSPAASGLIEADARHLLATAEQLINRLRAHGMAEKDAAAVAFSTITALLESPQKGTAFVQRLSAKK